MRVAKTWLLESASLEAFLDVLNVTVLGEVKRFRYTGGDGQPLLKRADASSVIIPSIGLKATY